MPVSTMPQARLPHSSAIEANIGSTEGRQPLLARSCFSRIDAPPSGSPTKVTCASPGAIRIRPGRNRIRSSAMSQGRRATAASCAAK
jgi:hypothetical protein